MFYSIMALIGLHVIIENNEVAAVSGFLHALEGSRDAGSSTFGSLSLVRPEAPCLLWSHPQHMDGIRWKELGSANRAQANIAVEMSVCP